MTLFAITNQPCECVGVLTYIRSAFRDGQVGAGTPRSALVVPLTAATIGPGGVVLTLAAQLLFVKHAAVGVKVALAPVKNGVCVCVGGWVGKRDRGGVENDMST